MNRVTDLRADYDRLGALLEKADARDAAAIVRERRLIGELLEALERPREVTKVAQLADQRRARTGHSRVAGGGRKSG